MNKHRQENIPRLPARIKRTARVLILRYSSHDLEFFGLWQSKKHKGIERLVLPGGQIKISYGANGEIKQEKIIKAAIRETREEIAVSDLYIKHYLGVFSHQTKQKTGYKHTYIFIGKIDGKVKVKETDKFNAHKSSFYPFRSMDKHPHAPHLDWIYKLYKQGELDSAIKRFLK